jgi:hypothetical protein
VKDGADDEDQVVSEDMSLQDVISLVLGIGRPSTLTFTPKKGASVHCSYAALIGNATDSEERPYVGKATHFVSYCWKYPVSVVLLALKSFEQKQLQAGAEPSYFFIDQFCLDQHTMSETAHDQDDDKYKQIVATLQKSIEVPGNVLMLLHPWDKPIVLSRAWCLFEIFTAIVTKANVQMLFRPDQEDLFNTFCRNAARENGIALQNSIAYNTTCPDRIDVSRRIPKVDAMQAAATVAADKTMILNRISQDVGMERYNEQLQQFLEKLFDAKTKIWEEEEAAFVRTYGCNSFAANVGSAAAGQAQLAHAENPINAFQLNAMSSIIRS